MSQSGGDTNNSGQIEGASDNTLIGNISDSLKVAITQQTANTDIATYWALASAVAIGNNKSMISIFNANGSSRICRIREIYLVNTQNAAITGIVGEFRLIRMTGHSAGTDITYDSYDTVDATDVNITVKTNATIAGEATRFLGTWKYSTDEWGVGAADVESFDHSFNAVTPIYRAKPPAKPITIRANQGLTLKHVVNSTAGSFDIGVLFTLE